MGQVFPLVLRFIPVNLIPPVLHYNKIRKILIIFITGLHNKPQGCGASVASAAGPFSKRKLDMKTQTSTFRLSATFPPLTSLHAMYAAKQYPPSLSPLRTSLSTPLDVFYNITHISSLRQIHSQNESRNVFSLGRIIHKTVHNICAFECAGYLQIQPHRVPNITVIYCLLSYACNH